MRGNAPQVVEALWAAKEEPPAKLVGFSFLELRVEFLQLCRIHPAPLARPFSKGLHDWDRIEI